MQETIVKQKPKQYMKFTCFKAETKVFAGAKIEIDYKNARNNSKTKA
jgi:hypothetical protein